MRISSRCEYGLRAMVYLAARQEERPVPLPEIAAGEGIPAAFLERILARLRDGGLIKATRGVSGGYQLARGLGGASPSATSSRPSRDPCRWSAASPTKKPARALSPAPRASSGAAWTAPSAAP